jgi:5'-nucleotidase / UDP-sugar diphosphatase
MARDRDRQCGGIRFAPSAIVSGMRQLSRLAVIIVIGVLSPPLRGHAQPSGATVTILHFNDVYEITPVEAGRAGGLARVARFRANLAAQHPGLISATCGWR